MVAAGLTEPFTGALQQTLSVSFPDNELVDIPDSPQQSVDLFEPLPHPSALGVFPANIMVALLALVHRAVHVRVAVAHGLLSYVVRAPVAG